MSPDGLQFLREETRAVALDRRDVILALIRAGNGEVAGITRLQKLLFLLEQEYGIKISDGTSDFEAYRFGPYSSKLYDDLQYLENINFLESDKPFRSDADVLEMDFGFLVSDSPSRTPSGEEFCEREHFAEEYSEGPGAGDLGPERRFRLTNEARDYLKEHFQSTEGHQADQACSDLKRRFRSLNQLIRYVYTRYPEFTTESEIREEIVGE